MNNKRCIFGSLLLVPPPHFVSGEEQTVFQRSECSTGFPHKFTNVIVNNLDAPIRNRDLHSKIKLCIISLNFQNGRFVTTHSCWKRDFAPRQQNKHIAGELSNFSELYGSKTQWPFWTALHRKNKMKTRQRKHSKRKWKQSRALPSPSLERTGVVSFLDTLQDDKRKRWWPISWILNFYFFDDFSDSPTDKCGKKRKMKPVGRVTRT